MARLRCGLLLGSLWLLMPAAADPATAQSECAPLRGPEQGYCRQFLAGDWQGARRAAEQMKAAARPGSLDQAKAQFQLAKPLLSLGLYREARAELEQALATVVRPAAPGPAALRSLLEPDINGKLGEALDRLGNCQDATAHLDNAVDLWQRNRAQNLENLAYAHNSLSRIHQSLGRYDLAETGFERAIADAEEAARRNRAAKARVAVYRNNLARLYQIRGDHQRMLEQATRALAAQGEAIRPDDPDYVQTLVAIAGALRGLPGRAAEGVPHLDRALRLAQGPTGRPDLVAAVLVAYANTNVALRRFADADRQFEQALALREKVLGRGHPLLAPPLDYWARLKLETGKVGEALDLSRRAAALAVDRLTKATSFVCSEDVSQLRGYFDTHLAVLDRAVAAGTGGDGLEEEAFETAQWAGGSAAAVAVSRMAARFQGGKDAGAATIREQQDDWMRRRDLEKALFLERSKRLADRSQERERALREAIVRLDGRLQKVDHLGGSRPLRPDEVQPLLGSDEVLLYHHVAEDRTYVFALSRDAFRRRSIPIGATAMAERVAAFRIGLDYDVRKDGVARAAGKAAGGRSLFDIGRAHRLYVDLVAPVEDLVAARRSVLFVPSGPLTSLPYHLLVRRQPAAPVPTIRVLDDFRRYADADWLLKSHAVTVLPAVANLKSLRVDAGASAGARALVGFADPVFRREGGRLAASAPSRPVRTSVDSLTRAYSPRDAVDLDVLAGGLDALPETADEVRRVATSLGAAASDLHLGRTAAEGFVKRADLRPYRVVYFATHGLVAGQVPKLDEPALVLSLPPEPTEDDDGLLKASEVARLRLDADWVVLSACNTAAAEKAVTGARSASTEALSGLARAFFYAGARALLVTHWEAYSDAAAELTARTFELIRQRPELGRAQALRLAMLEQMADPRDPTAAYPEVWAPFQFIGAGVAQ